MNAEEARRKALENAKDEIRQIKYEIEKAVKKGEIHLWAEGLKEGTQEWLKENGYEYSEDFISW